MLRSLSMKANVCPSEADGVTTEKRQEVAKTAMATRTMLNPYTAETHEVFICVSSAGS